MSNPNKLHNNNKLFHRLLFVPRRFSTGAELDKLKGKFQLADGTHLQIVAQLNAVKEDVVFHLDTGASISQIDHTSASMLGLRSHPMLIGRSLIANGSVKYDYLCPTSISILGVEAPITVKVAPKQPILLGLDVMLLFDMEAKFLRQEFTIARKITDPKKTKFRFLTFDALLEELNLSEADLVPVDSLPHPTVSFKELVNAGKANCVIDLGTTFANAVQTRTPPSIVDLGTSY